MGNPVCKITISGPSGTGKGVAMNLIQKTLNGSSLLNGRTDFIYEDRTERHDQQIDNVDNYDIKKSAAAVIEIMDEIKDIVIGKDDSEKERRASELGAVYSPCGSQPYTPQVGEECEVICHDDSVPVYFKITFVAVLNGCLVYKDHTGIFETTSTNFEFRPLKTERDQLFYVAAKVIEIAHKEKDRSYGSLQNELTINALIDAGWRPTNGNTHSK